MRKHVPVMVDEVVTALQPKDGEVYVDGTFGAGGYTRSFLAAADCTVIAIDRDEEAVERSKPLQKEFGNRLIVVHGRFGDVLDLVKASGYGQVDGFVLDLGVSSFQIDGAERGFSFRFDGPLDMRMDRSHKESAKDIVNALPEVDLANIIYRYGEERRSRKIAKKIVEKRREKTIETTTELAEIVRSVVPRAPGDKSDPATRTFQALRIAVNDELGELERALDAAEKLLKPGGRLVVVSFHSLEDGLVKSFMYEKSGRTASVSRHVPAMDKGKGVPVFHMPGRRHVSPSAEEVERNPRSRSARLRRAVRVGGEAV